MGNTQRCWNCGRATQQWWGNEYVFGAICDRADCQKVKEGIPNRFRRWNMHVSLPTDGVDGKPSCWTVDGDVNWTQA